MIMMTLSKWPRSVCLRKRGQGVRDSLKFPVFKSPSAQNQERRYAFSLVLARRLYAAPSSQGRVCAEIDSVISQRRRLLHSTVGLPSRNDDGFRDFAWQESASLRSHESLVCHWAGRDTAIRPLCQRRTIGWHWSDPRWTGKRFHSSLPPPPSASTLQPKINKL